MLSNAASAALLAALALAVGCATRSPVVRHAAWNAVHRLPAGGAGRDGERVADALGLGAPGGGAVPARPAGPPRAGGAGHAAGARTGPLPPPRPLGPGAGVRRVRPVLVAPGR